MAIPWADPGTDVLVTSQGRSCHRMERDKWGIWPIQAQNENTDSFLPVFNTLIYINTVNLSQAQQTL